MGEQVVLGRLAPEPLVRRAETVELRVKRIRLAQLREVGDGGHRHLHVRVDKTLAARDLEEVKRGPEGAVESAHVRDQRRHRGEEEDVIVAAARGRHGAGAARALKLNILEPRIGGPVQSPGLRLHPIRSFNYST